MRRMGSKKKESCLSLSLLFAANLARFTTSPDGSLLVLFCAFDLLLRFYGSNLISTFSDNDYLFSLFLRQK